MNRIVSRNRSTLCYPHSSLWISYNVGILNVVTILILQGFIYMKNLISERIGKNLKTHLAPKAL